MTYTGHSKLDRAIGSFIERGMYFDPHDGGAEIRQLQDLRSAQHAYCMCDAVSRQFIKFVAEHFPQLNVRLMRDADPSLFGLPNLDGLSHTVAQVSVAGGHVTIDFTAAQYDEDRNWPLVCSFAA